MIGQSKENERLPGIDLFLFSRFYEVWKGMF